MKGHSHFKALLRHHLRKLINRHCGCDANLIRVYKHKIFLPALVENVWKAFE